MLMRHTLGGYTVMRKRLVWAMAALLLLPVAWTAKAARTTPAASTNLQNRLVGNWKMTARVVRHADGTSNPDPNFGPEYPIGYIMYDSTDHMAVQFMALNRPSNHSTQGYEAYFGTYTINETAAPPTVTHHLEGGLNPESVGKNLVRDLLLDGDKLMLVIHTDTTDVNVNSFMRIK